MVSSNVVSVTFMCTCQCVQCVHTGVLGSACACVCVFVCARVYVHVSVGVCVCVCVCVIVMIHERFVKKNKSFVQSGTNHLYLRSSFQSCVLGFAHAHYSYVRLVRSVSVIGSFILFLHCACSSLYQGPFYVWGLNACTKSISLIVKPIMVIDYEYENVGYIVYCLST